MNKNEGLKRLNSLVTYDRGVRLKYSSFRIFHFLFLISHPEQRLLINLLKGVKCVLSILQKKPFAH